MHEKKCDDLKKHIYKHQKVRNTVSIMKNKIVVIQYMKFKIANNCGLDGQSQLNSMLLSPWLQPYNIDIIIIGLLTLLLLLPPIVRIFVLEVCVKNTKAESDHTYT